MMCQMRIIIFTFFLVSTFFQISYASIKSNIIAKVGNEIITSFELENKIKTTLLLSNRELSQSNIDQVKNYAFKSLINLKLKNEELKKYKINLNQAAIDQHLKKISKQLGINIIQLEGLFDQYQIDYNRYLNEIKIEFLWQKLIFNLYSKNISIDEDQIVKELNDIVIKNKKIEEFNLAEIEIELENLSEKSKIINEIKKYISEIGFEKTAINFSIASTGLSGGDLGWVNSSSLTGNFLDILKDMNIGDVSDPIVRSNKIVFIKLVDQRTVNNNENLDVEKIKFNLINRKKNELLESYSNSHLSKKKNTTLVEIK